MTSKYQNITSKLLKFGKSTAIIFIVFYTLSFAMDYWRGKTLPIKDIPIGIYQDIHNQSINLHDISKDQITIVYFWATWCTPCKVTSPSMQQLAKSYPVISIAMKSGDSSKLQGYFNNQNTDSPIIPIINDNSRSISNNWGVQVTPTILFIKDGQLLSHTTGISGYPSLWLRAWWLNK